jgi:hypothetical protein
VCRQQQAKTDKNRVRSACRICPCSLRLRHVGISARRGRRTTGFRPDTAKIQSVGNENCVDERKNLNTASSSELDWVADVLVHVEPAGMSSGPLGDR